MFSRTMVAAADCINTPPPSLCLSGIMWDADGSSEWQCGWSRFHSWFKGHIQM